MRKAIVIAVLICAVVLSGCGRGKVIEKGIVLEGRGTVKAVPDIADFTIRVVTTDANNNSSNAIRSNARKCEVISAALLNAGVQKKDIATIDFQAASGRNDSGYPRYRPIGKPYFRVSNTIRVTVRKVQDVGTIIDAAVSAGANSVDSVTFRFSDPAKLRARALAEAVKDAKVKAQAVADAGGVKLLTISKVEETTADYDEFRNVPRFQSASKVAAMPGVAQTFAEPGEQKILVEVTAAFAIRRG